jgi:hypothetical protein
MKLTLSTYELNMWILQDFLENKWTEIELKFLWGKFIPLADQTLMSGMWPRLIFMQRCVHRHIVYFMKWNLNWCLFLGTENEAIDSWLTWLSQKAVQFLNEDQYTLAATEMDSQPQTCMAVDKIYKQVWKLVTYRVVLVYLGLVEDRLYKIWLVLSIRGRLFKAGLA